MISKGTVATVFLFLASAPFAAATILNPGDCAGSAPGCLTLSDATGTAWGSVTAGGFLQLPFGNISPTPFPSFGELNSAALFTPSGFSYFYEITLNNTNPLVEISSLDLSAACPATSPGCFGPVFPTQVVSRTDFPNAGNGFTTPTSDSLYSIRVILGADGILHLEIVFADCQGNVCVAGSPLLAGQTSLMIGLTLPGLVAPGLATVALHDPAQNLNWQLGGAVFPAMVPEPGTFGLVCISLIALALKRLRRRPDHPAGIRTEP